MMDYRKLAAALMAIAAERWPKAVSQRTVGLATAEGDLAVNLLRALANAMLEGGLDKLELAAAAASANGVNVKQRIAESIQFDANGLLEAADAMLRSSGNVERWFVDWHSGFMSRLATGTVTPREWSILWLTVNR